MNDQGIRQLWASVISQAICDVDLRGDRVVRAQAMRWLNSDAQNEGSLRWICDMLDLDADRIRMMCMSRTGRKSLTGKLFSRRALEKRLEDEEESRDLSFDFHEQG